MTHAETCRQIARVEDVPRLADCPYLRLTCVHGHSWHVTEDGAPLPAPEARKPRRPSAPLQPTGSCAWCHKALPADAGNHGNRRYCPPPDTCAGQAKRERERAWRQANARATA